MIIGAGSNVLAFFHLIIHAYFKSALFICIGFIIHNIRGNQDCRFSGVLNFRRPLLGVIFGCCNLSLCGFPFLSGFYSKDRILEHCLRGSFGIFLVICSVLATGLTVSYSFRSIFLSVNFQSKILAVNVNRDFRGVLLISRFFLFFLSIFSGFFFG